MERSGALLLWKSEMETIADESCLPGDAHSEAHRIEIRPKKDSWGLSNQTSPALVDVLCKSQTAGATWTMCLAECGMSGLGAVTASSGVPLDDDLLSAASRTSGGLLRAGRNGTALPPRPPSSRRSPPRGCDGMMHSKSCSEDEARGGVYIVDVPGPRFPAVWRCNRRIAPIWAHEKHQAIASHNRILVFVATWALVADESSGWLRMALGRLPADSRHRAGEMGLAAKTELSSVEKTKARIGIIDEEAVGNDTVHANSGRRNTGASCARCMDVEEAGRCLHCTKHEAQ
ncbi:hypothetical protein CMUS01_01917 [Colletotrichum musicola]|uniref:Uncharacterized protein n=1 Tax=Colletotrichum musicola TaxID=2175873 RepID=A0A8H6NW65_9PEZI|nr:hypothetical protein CMUS01_01917 [Colletotrichum musicola]